MVSLDMDEQDFTDSKLDYMMRTTFKEVVQGKRESYDQLVSILHQKGKLTKDELALLMTGLKAVTGAVSCLNLIHHKALLGSIFNMNLWNYGTDVMDALIELLISLASTSGEYIDLCLETLVSNFIPPQYSTKYFLDKLSEPQGRVKKIQVLDRVHTTLKNIANVVPLSPLRLQKIVRDRMPNIYSKELFMVMYTENMMRLETGVMGEIVGSSMIVAIMDMLIDLDVEIPWDEILQDDFQRGFDMGLENLEWNTDHIEQDCNEPTREDVILRFFSGNLVAQKLDSMMVLTFEHLQNCYNMGRLEQVFERLLHSFEKTILTAYKSKFAQFVLFYATSLAPDYCGQHFAVLLCNIFVSNAVPEWRMSAAAYLASYLARAKFLPITYVTESLEKVVNWCFDYCKIHDEDINNPKAHKVFYAGCQAIMYVLCFRMKQMLAFDTISHVQVEQLNKILGHHLKPLQVCLPSIVEEFVRLAKENNIFSLPESTVDYGLLESELSQAFGGTERLDMFFPFDPCLLSKSDSFIRPNYMYWSMVRSTYEEDDDDHCTSDDDDDAGGAHAQNGLNIPHSRRSSMSYDEENSDVDEFDCSLSLDKMSITPRDSSIKFGGRIQSFSQMPSKIRPSTSPESV